MIHYQDCILVTDMDGTLLNSNSKISEKNCNAIEFFKGNGGKFAIATGRTEKSVATFFKQAKPNAPCIFYNGAVLYDWDEQKFLKTQNVKSKELIEFLKDCMEIYPTLCIRVYTTDKNYIITGEKSLNRFVVGSTMEFIFADLSEVLNKSWLKVLLAEERDILETCKAKLNKYHLEDTTNHFFSADYYFEFVDKGVSKGAMVKMMKSLNEFEGKIVFATGDFHNDIEMLQVADVGIAPANAEPEVKAVADMISVTNDNDLIHQIIYHIIPDYFNKRMKGQ